MHCSSYIVEVECLEYRRLERDFKIIIVKLNIRYDLDLYFGSNLKALCVVYIEYIDQGWRQGR